jgi:hypothetical protein
MKPIDPKALFRLSVLGPLVSRERLERGELQQIIRELAEREYAIPGTRRRHLGEKTIQGWYYTYRPRPRWPDAEGARRPRAIEALRGHPGRDSGGQAR